MKLNLLPQPKGLRGGALMATLGLGLVACAPEKPLPQGASITVEVPRTDGSRFPRHDLVTPQVVNSNVVGRLEGRDAMLNGTLLDVRLNGVPGPITAGAWLCLSAAGETRGLELTESAFLALEPALDAWNTSGRSSPESSCDLRAAAEQLASIRTANSAHATALGSVGRTLNYSRVSVQTRSPRGSARHTMTAASYFCALRLGLAGGVTLDPDANPRLKELTSIWKAGAAGQPWVCDPVRVKEELGIIRGAVAPAGRP